MTPGPDMAIQRRSVQETLAAIIGGRTSHPGDFETPIAGLAFFGVKPRRRR